MQVRYKKYVRFLITLCKNGTLWHGIRAILGPKIWIKLPNEFKEIDDINTFKAKIKTCPFRLFKTNIQRVGFKLISK